MRQRRPLLEITLGIAVIGRRQVVEQARNFEQIGTPINVTDLGAGPVAVWIEANHCAASPRYAF
jgi:hypothetical protein